MPIRKICDKITLIKIVYIVPLIYIVGEIVGKKFDKQLKTMYHIMIIRNGHGMLRKITKGTCESLDNERLLCIREIRSQRRLSRCSDMLIDGDVKKNSLNGCFLGEVMKS